MKESIICAVLIALLLSVVLVGCGSAEDEIVGKWYAETYSLNGVTKSADEMGFDFSGADYTFYSDGTYQTAISWDRGTWSMEGNVVILNMEDGKSTKLIYDGGKLISNSDSGLKITYGK